jgi:hypothetical protein
MNEVLKRPIESDFLSHVAYARALEVYCNSLESQEPVACIYNGYLFMAHEFQSGQVPVDSQPLYTHPPAAQRQWIGLAEEDKHKPDMGAYVYLNDDWLDGYKTGMEYAEAILKEKNNG